MRSTSKEENELSPFEQNWKIVLAGADKARETADKAIQKGIAGRAMAYELRSTTHDLMEKLKFISEKMSQYRAQTSESLTLTESAEQMRAEFAKTGKSERYAVHATERRFLALKEMLTKRAAQGRIVAGTAEALEETENQLKEALGHIAAVRELMKTLG